MEVIKGKIEQINVKEPKKGEYGCYAQFGVKVDGGWHNGMCKEQNGEVWPYDKNKVKLMEGQDVEFLVKENGDYKNIEMKEMKVTGGREPQSIPASKPNIPSEKNSHIPDDKRVWLSCLQSACTLGSGAKIVVNGDEDAAKATSDLVVRVANNFYQKCNETFKP